MRALVGFFLISMAAVAQEERKSIQKVERQYASAIMQIRGVLKVEVESGHGHGHLIVRVANQHAKAAVRRLLGKSIHGYAVRVVLSSSKRSSHAARARACDKACSLHCVLFEAQECDIVRKEIGLPKRKVRKRDPICQQVSGWTSRPKKVSWVVEKKLPHWASKQMPSMRGVEDRPIRCATHGQHRRGETISYTQMKHRKKCPLSLKSVLTRIAQLSLKEER